MSCNLIGDAPDYSGECLAWVQSQLGLPHVGATAAAAWANNYAGYRTSTPQFGDLAFFLNGGAGHVGIYEGNNTFRSVWTSGAICDSDITQFAAENGDTFAGYVSTAAIGGQVQSLNPSTSVPAILSGIPPVFVGIGALAAVLLVLDEVA